jgi:preprotein translocase subunit SecA
MREWWRSLFTARTESAPQQMDEVRTFRDGFEQLDDESLKRAARSATRLPEIVAVTAVVASRVLGLQMFDSQLAGCSRPHRERLSRRSRCGMDA